MVSWGGCEQLGSQHPGTRAALARSDWMEGPRLLVPLGRATAALWVFSPDGSFS